MHFLWFIIIGAVAGWLAGTLMKGGGFGLLGDIVVGILGGIIGGWLAGALGIGAGGLLGSLLIATGGAIVLILIIRMLKKLSQKLLVFSTTVLLPTVTRFFIGINYFNTSRLITIFCIALVPSPMVHSLLSR